MGISSIKDLHIGLNCFVLGMLYQLVNNWNLLHSSYCVNTKGFSILTFGVGVLGGH